MERLPLSAPLRAHAGVAGAAQLALGGGDDYELCFAVPPDRLQQLSALVNVKCQLSCIGRLEAGSGITVLEQGRSLTRGFAGFDHFLAD